MEFQQNSNLKEKQKGKGIMEIIKKRFHIDEISKIKYKDDAILVYTQNKVYICSLNSEKYLTDGMVEYTLKNLGVKNGQK